jgi:uncharacterized membrane-anchored protein
MAIRSYLVSVVATALLLAGIASGWAQDQQSQEQGVKQAQDLQAAVDAMQKVLQPGPSDVTLLSQATLHIPKGANFVPQPQAGAWAMASGYGKDGDLIGIVVPSSEENWITFIDYHDNVRIADGEAGDWNADTLLANLRASTEQGNAERQKRDEPQLEVRSWLEKPNYDAAAHKLIWSAVSPERGADDDDGSGNVHGYALGRDGYFELTMVSPAGEIASHVPVAKAILAGIQFGIGRRYEDYASSRDTMEKSITALISLSSPGFGQQVLGFLKIYWIWIVLGLLVLLALIGGLARAVRR